MHDAEHKSQRCRAVYHRKSGVHVKKKSSEFASPLQLDELNLKDEGGFSRDLGGSSGGAITKVKGDHQLALLSFTHPEEGKKGQVCRSPTNNVTHKICSLCIVRLPRASKWNGVYLTSIVINVTKN